MFIPNIQPGGFMNRLFIGQPVSSLVLMLGALHGFNERLANRIVLVCTWLFLAYLTSTFLGWTLDMQGLQPGTIANFRALGWTLVIVLAMALLRASACWTEPDDASNFPPA